MIKTCNAVHVTCTPYLHSLEGAEGNEIGGPSYTVTGGLCVFVQPPKSHAAPPRMPGACPREATASRKSLISHYRQQPFTSQGSSESNFAPVRMPQHEADALRNIRAFRLP